MFSLHKGEQDLSLHIMHAVGFVGKFPRFISHTMLEGKSRFYYRTLERNLIFELFHNTHGDVYGNVILEAKVWLEVCMLIIQQQIINFQRAMLIILLQFM